MSKDGENNFRNLILNNFVYVAEHDEKLVGYICGYICKKEPWYNVQFAELLNLYVEEKYRCIRIGTTLLNEFKNYCKSNNVTCMKLNTLYSNKNAINFYMHNGFNNYTNTYICDI
jgi:ribosomal protein S18 acetylase RimI-like enzyme